VKEWLDKIPNIETVVDINKAVGEVIDDVLVKKELAARAKNLKLVWNPSVHGFVKPEPELVDA
jgi:hypothetical protein